MYSIAKYAKRASIFSLITPAVIFMVSTMIVNGGNYLYNLILGRTLEPSEFSNAGLLITLLLVFSFLAMTFQIVAAKYSIELHGNRRLYFQHWISRIGRDTGLLLGFIFFALGGKIASLFQLSNSYSIYLMGVCLPFFFVMSTRRGFLQGKEDFIRLSASYQAEMWVKLLLTFSLLYIYYVPSELSISIAISTSILVCLFITKPLKKITFDTTKFSVSKSIVHFMFLTAVYEGTQIIINYSDILFVKHFFEHESAGLYTSMALIGRVIYFMTWMLVMILIPKVLIRKKEGLSHREILLKYVGLIGTFSIALILGCYFFNKEIVTALFGSAYLGASGLLWKYGLATMLFALANLFIYYFLCLDQRLPVYLACIFSIIQLVLLSTYHNSLEQIVWVQVANMGTLLLIMLSLFITKEYLLNTPKKN